jgi:hypothetical protein
MVMATPIRALTPSLVSLKSSIRDKSTGSIPLKGNPESIIINKRGDTLMSLKMNKTNLKRLSKGQRSYTRRMKQTARKEGTIYRSARVNRTPEKPVGE